MQLFARSCLDTSCSDARYPRIGTKAANSEQYLLETQKKDRPRRASVCKTLASEAKPGLASSRELALNWTNVHLRGSSESRAHVCDPLQKFPLTRTCSKIYLTAVLSRQP